MNEQRKMNPMRLNVPLTAVKGAVGTKRMIRARIGFYEGIKVRVRKQMPAKFPPTMVQQALDQCDEMLDFYEDLYETF